MKKKFVIALIFVLLLIPSIPMIDASDTQIIENNDTNLKIKDDIEKSKMISNEQELSSSPENESSILIVSSGEGRGYFFPPRVGRKKFFCCAAIIIYTSLFSASRIQGKTHTGPHMFIFIGLARVWYKKHIVLRDDISLFGVGFARVVIDIF